MADEPRTLRLDVGERYPFFQEVIGPRTGYAVDVPVETADRWKRVMVELGQVQEEMEAAYDAAKARDEEARRIEQAEAEVAAAQTRLDQVLYEQEHPPNRPESWPIFGDAPCAGRDYGSRKAALQDRVRIHQTWPDMLFDLAAYVCVNGHTHLGRTS